MKEIIEKFSSLMSRWEDECEYEDWNDYVMIMRMYIAKFGGGMVWMYEDQCCFTFQGKMHTLTVLSDRVIVESEPLRKVPS